MEQQFKAFQKELTRFTTEPSTYESKFPAYLEDIRKSSLSSQKIAELRDSIDTHTITSDGVKLRNLVRGQLQTVYEERVRAEIHANKPTISRFLEKYPLSRVLIELVKIVVAVGVGYYLNELLRK